MAEKINIRGTMNSLEVGKCFTLSRQEYRRSTVAITASALFYDFGKKFSVSMNDTDIIVTRTK